MATPARDYLRERWPYDEALQWMDATRERVLAGGVMALGVGSHDREVITLGRHAPETQLLAPDALAARGVLVRRVERGGGATAHGPGQLVLYPVLSLPALALDVPRFTSRLERAVVDLLVELGIEAVPGQRARGVYVGGAKVASIGFRVVRGVVTHGLALNVCNDLSLFRLIDACGQGGQPVTSVAVLRPALNVDMREIARCLTSHVRRHCMLESPP